MSQIASGAEVGIAKTKTLAGLSLKVFLQPPYQRLPWHTHRDASICFVVSGSYTERFGSAVRECTPHSMVFKPAVERHTDQFGRLGGTCLLVEIPAHRLSMLEPVARVTAQPTLVRSAKLAALGHDLYGEVVHEDALSSFAVEGLVLEILAEASRRRSASAGPPPGPAWLRQAHDLIHETFVEPLTLASVARMVGVHPSHLARTFRAYYGCSIGAYVRRLRVERACQELADTDAALAQIALRAGFFDQSHFSRVFKAQTRKTPAQFRMTSRGRTSRPTPRAAFSLRPRSNEHDAPS